MSGNRLDLVNQIVTELISQDTVTRNNSKRNHRLSYGRSLSSSSSPSSIALNGSTPRSESVSPRPSTPSTISITAPTPPAKIRSRTVSNESTVVWSEENVSPPRGSQQQQRETSRIKNLAGPAVTTIKAGRLRRIPPGAVDESKTGGSLPASEEVDDVEQWRPQVPEKVTVGSLAAAITFPSPTLSSASSSSSSSSFPSSDVTSTTADATMKDDDIDFDLENVVFSSAQRFDSPKSISTVKAIVMPISRAHSSGSLMSLLDDDTMGGGLAKAAEREGIADRNRQLNALGAVGLYGLQQETIAETVVVQDENGVKDVAIEEAETTTDDSSVSDNDEPSSLVSSTDDTSLASFQRQDSAADTPSPSSTAVHLSKNTETRLRNASRQASKALKLVKKLAAETAARELEDEIERRQVEAVRLKRLESRKDRSTTRRSNSVSSVGNVRASVTVTTTSTSEATMGMTDTVAELAKSWRNSLVSDTLPSPISNTTTTTIVRRHSISSLSSHAPVTATVVPSAPTAVSQSIIISPTIVAPVVIAPIIIAPVIVSPPLASTAHLIITDIRSILIPPDITSLPAAQSLPLTTRRKPVADSARDGASPAKRPASYVSTIESIASSSSNSTIVPIRAIPPLISPPRNLTTTSHIVRLPRDPIPQYIIPEYLEYLEDDVLPEDRQRSKSRRIFSNLGSVPSRTNDKKGRSVLKPILSLFSRSVSSSTLPPNDIGSHSTSTSSKEFLRSSSRMGFSDDDDGTTSKHNNVLYSMMRFTDRLLGVEMEEIPTYASPVLGRSPVLGSERQRIDERGRQSLAIEKPAFERLSRTKSAVM